jgi:hypothetical protein
MGPVGLKAKNHCAGEDQQQFSSQSVKPVSLESAVGEQFVVGREKAPRLAAIT